MGSYVRNLEQYDHLNSNDPLIDLDELCVLILESERGAQRFLAAIYGALTKSKTGNHHIMGEVLMGAYVAWRSYPANTLWEYDSLTGDLPLLNMDKLCTMVIRHNYGAHRLLAAFCRALTRSGKCTHPELAYEIRVGFGVRPELNHD
jgi:hypothetical protein